MSLYEGLHPLTAKKGGDKRKKEHRMPIQTENHKLRGSRPIVSLDAI